MPSEAHVESATMAWFAGLGYETAHDRDVGPDAEDTAKRLRDSYAEVILGRTLDEALASLNPDLPPEALAQASDHVTRASLPDPIRENRRLHQALVNGVRVEVRLADGTITGKTVKFADFGMTAPSVPFRVVSVVDEIRLVVTLVATGPAA